MRVLVTGGAGFIGSHVAEAYVSRGHEVSVVDNLSTGRRENVPPEARFYVLDLQSPELEKVLAAEKPEVVNHHGANADLRRSVVEPLYDAEANVLGSLNLLEACVRHGVRKVIYSSSGGSIYGEPERLPCDEGHPIRPLSPYAANKYMVEMYLYMYKQNHGLDYTVLRYPNVYGPRQDPNGEAGVVAIFAAKMLKGQPVVINGTGEQERDFLYVGDCVSANLIALDQSSGGVYNLGTGAGTSVNQIFEMLGSLTGYQLDPQHGPPKAGETFRICLSAEKIRRELGWSPHFSLAQGLQRTVDFFRSRGGH